jgi:hypothetical protein
MSGLRALAAGSVVLLGAVAVPGVSASAAAPSPCAQPQPNGPMQVTADCVDPLYAHPVIDGEKDLTSPVPHHQVSGHFEGTGVKFNLYLPPANRWDGRFFQLVYPLQSENADAQSIAFGADSGAYTVQTSGTEGYRADAAAAKFSRTVAAKYYRSSRRIHGYIYGGSGGSYMTIGAMENTTAVWDGAVPFIPGVPTSIPNNFFVRAFARLVLRGKAPQIADAVRPGGSGNPYAGLTSTQKAVLREVTRMGIPLRAWENHSYVLGLDDPQGLLGFAGTVRAIDPTYADDFWTKPGYLGTERSPLGDLTRNARIDQTATITEVERDDHDVPTKLTLDKAPADPNKLGFDVTASRADGTTIGAVTGSLDPATRTFTIGTGNSSETLDAISAGGKLRIDNRWNLALLTYHRHQVPARSGFAAWDQFRDSTGEPIYPQRAVEIGPVISGEVSGGGTHTGRITGKVIEVANLLDTDAFPWDADWYAQQVRNALGSRYDDEFRVWFNDNADHIGAHETNLLDYTGVLQQALRDVSAWAEKGIAPPQSTRYSVTGGQVTVPATPAQRHGIQPVVTLTVDGRHRIDVPAGKPVTFTATIQTPPGTGKIVATAWDFTGGGTFTPARFGGPPRPSVHVRQTYTYSKPGTYYPALRATAQRDGDAATPFATIPDLGRVRVVVH